MLFHCWASGTLLLLMILVIPTFICALPSWVPQLKKLGPEVTAEAEDVGWKSKEYGLGRDRGGLGDLVNV